MSADETTFDVAIIGAGPAGLIAAQVLATAGKRVAVFDRNRLPGRKFLLAGRGGLNLTHSQQRPYFDQAYGDSAAQLTPILDQFGPDQMVQFCHDLGFETFVGSSGRVFPKPFTATTLLREWIRKLDGLGVRYFGQHLFQGWDEQGTIRFQHGDQTILVKATAQLLAMGGGSWPRLGSDGAWVESLNALGIDIEPLAADNAGVLVKWSQHFADKFRGQPLKSITLEVGGKKLRGEAMITPTGLEGQIIYALNSVISHSLKSETTVTLTLDLKPDWTVERLQAQLSKPRNGQSMANVLRKAAGLSPVHIQLLRELTETLPHEPAELAQAIKSLPLNIHGMAGIERAISTSGGVVWHNLNPELMVHHRPGLFVAGEMIAWSAPTGGYLLTACFATGVQAAQGILKFLNS